jgi:hypothetical protein
VQERLDKPKRRNRQVSQAFLIGQAVALATEPFAPGATALRRLDSSRRTSTTTPWRTSTSPPTR